MKINKIVRIALSGGLIGLILTNPRKALDNMIEKNNNDGWNAIYYTTHSESNIIIIWFLKNSYLFYHPKNWKVQYFYYSWF